MALEPGSNPCAAPVLLVTATAEQKRRLRRVFVWFPISFLQNGGECFADFNTNLNCARQSVQLLFVLAHLAACPWLCTARGKLLSKELKEEDKMPVMRGVMPGGRVVAVPRVVVTLEVVRTADGVGVGGIRVWFDVQDASMDLNRGIEALIYLNTVQAEKDSHKMRPPPPPLPYEAYKFVTSRSAWVDEFLGAQCEVPGDSALLTALDAPGNTADVYDRLGWERGMRDLVRDRPGRFFQAQTAYYGNYGIGDPEDGPFALAWPRPHDVYTLGYRNACPDTLFMCRLPHLGTGAAAGVGAAAAHARLLTPPQQRAEARLAQRHALSHGMPAPDPSMDSMDRLAAAARIKKGELDRLGGTPAERAERRRDWAYSPASQEDFEQAFFAGDPSEKIAQVARWIRDRQNAAPDGSFSMMSPQRRAIDPVLSHFGNFAAYFLMDMEVHYGVKTLHSTVLLMWLASLGVYQSAMNMKTNVILSGAAQTGKSFVGWLLRFHLLPAHMLEMASRSTKRAFETSTDKKHYAYYSDEFQNDALGVNQYGETVGTGDPVMKEAITNQLIVTLDCVRGDDQSRKMVKCVSRMICCFLGNTNFDKAALPAAMQTRFLIRNCVTSSRPGHGLKEQAFSREREADAADVVRETEEIDLRYQKIATLVPVVEQLIYTGRLPEPCLLAARTVDITMCEYLDTKGIDTEQGIRHSERTAGLCRTLAIVCAVDAVFNTDVEFEPGRPFELADVMRVEHHLVVTEEMAMFIGGLTIDQYVDVEQARPVIGLAVDRAMYVPGQPATDDALFARRDKDASDFNYVLIEKVFADRGQGVDHVKALADIMMKCGQSGDSITSRENMAGIVRTLMQGRMLAVPYVGLNERAPAGSQERYYQHIKIDMGQNCAQVSRHFLEMVATRDYEEIAIRAVEACEHKHTVPRRVVCGVTYGSRPRARPAPVAAPVQTSTSAAPTSGRRGGTTTTRQSGGGAPIAAEATRRERELIEMSRRGEALVGEGAAGEEFITMPHIWRCVDLRPNPAKTMCIMNARGYDFADPLTHEAPGMFVVTEDLEDTAFRQHIRRCGIRRGPELDRACEALPSRMRARMLASRTPAEGPFDVYPLVIGARYVERERRTMRERADPGLIDLTRGDYSLTVPRVDDGLDEALARKRGRFERPVRAPEPSAAARAAHAAGVAGARAEDDDDDDEEE